MNLTRVLGLSLIVLTLLINPSRATAASCSAHCTEIWYIGEADCTGANGCQSSRPIESCSFGCVCGTCQSRGSSGECCGRIYYVPNVYSAPGDCTNECGAAPIHARTHVNRQNPNVQYNVDLRQDYAPGLIMLTPTKSYREPLFIYAYDRCSHTYRLIAEEDQPGKSGGM